ncbi:MAG TPA: bifunctional (p)ppGpp synthetase/guanosine-3',5'-bis(diphosphate) 3'-pyrophosphohydrolase [Firmicutes bacterium]|nr:bifunctional (p)ppGpp synthetase/guanosine-3',5'-bis(diphosphate) 3'-pyrophosphohydrolase [Bacillota bacterium]
MSLEQLLGRIREYAPDADLSPVIDAYHFSKEVHQGQYRDSEEPYFSHPFQVAMILADLEMEATIIAGGLLHDVVEDTDVTLTQIRERFGDEIALFVDGVTKLSKLPFRTKKEQQAESLRKLFLAMAQDVRVVIIKLADRLHNMRTLDVLSVERQQKIARETLEIYCPLANRLGMWQIKWEMEELAFRYLYPEDYFALVEQVGRKRSMRDADLVYVMDQLKKRLDQMGIKAELSGRTKHVYSIYQKMKTQNKTIDEIYDLLGVRVIVNSVKDCYGVLGIVHSLWKPVPGRFKDYIAMPKANMYRSLHTTVIGPGGEAFEVQIRTWEMHWVAERGIAAHWLYKEGGSQDSKFELKMAWLREVMDWLKEMKDPDEFIEMLKTDLFEDEVFVFTPKGDVKTLPMGATPVDFAFSVHTDVGLKCAGAKVNGRIVPLDYQLKNGEFVEILTANNASPSRDWLNFVKTSKARSKIRAFLKEERREENLQRGKELLEREAKKFGVDPSQVLKPDKLTQAAGRYGFVSGDDLLAAIGFGKVPPRQALGKIIDPKELEKRRQELNLARKKQQMPEPLRRQIQGVRCRGVDNLLVRFSRCCNPVPGDPIVGYITRGRGVSIHREDCPNVTYLENEPERRIEVEWVEQTEVSYPVEIRVEAIDRVNLLANIMNTVSEQKTNIEGVNARVDRDKAIIDLVLDIYNVGHMNSIINQLKQVSGVLDVYRAHPT